MKPAPSTLERETTLPVKESIEFTIGDARALMRINAKQYSDITTAIIREYSTNAYDAHIMAGHDDPIEVTLPTLMEPHFIVRDHGVGMNIDTFREIYTRFGTSDKTDNPRANGQMGIGSKSGVAYTTQFLVTSVKDNIKTHAKIRREKDWAIFMDVIDESIVDEPNGTEIRIEVHNVDEFRQKANAFYKFWLPGRVLIDGVPSVHYVGQKIADNLYFSRDWNTSYVVLANAPYRINNPAALFRNSKLSSLNFVAYVDDLAIADGVAPIEFTPSREDLEYSEHTRATLSKIIHKFEDDLMATAEAELKSAKTHSEAYTVWSKWKGTMHGRLFSDLTFKGEKFRSDFPVVARKAKANGSRGTEAVREWGVESCEKTLFVTECGVNTTKQVRDKVKAYIDQTWAVDDFAPTHVLFLPDPKSVLDSVWVDWDKMHIVTWAEIKKALPKFYNPRNYVPGSGRVPGSWDYWTRDGKVVEASVPTDKKLLWMEKTHDNKVNQQGVLEMLNSDAVVLLVPANRYAKLMRENPGIESFWTWARAQVKTDGPSLLSKDAKRVFGINSDRVNWINKLDMSRVDDKDLHKDKILLVRRDELLKEYNLNKRLADMLRMGYNGFTEYTPNRDGVTDFYHRYPLLAQISMYRAIDDDVYIYMNAKYKAETENKK